MVYLWHTYGALRGLGNLDLPDFTYRLTGLMALCKSHKSHKFPISPDKDLGKIADVEVERDIGERGEAD